LDLVEDIVAQNCNGNGVSLNGSGTGCQRCTIRRCRLEDNVVNGLAVGSTGSGEQNIIDDCQALNNGTGFLITGTGNLIIRNFATGNSANNYDIVASNRLGAIITPTSIPSGVTTSGGGTGTSDPFAN